MKKNAFTLAEIMIVLTVIGILTAILLPVAFHSTPDEDAMKFKKAVNTFGTAVRELINSDKYFFEGDFGKKPDGSLINNYNYFCSAMADMVSTKEVNCGATTAITTYTSSVTFFSDSSKTDATGLATFKAALDTACNDKKGSYKGDGFPGFKMADGVTIYFLRPAFGLKDGTAATSKRIYADPAGAPADIKYKDAATGFDAAHVVACIDVDELNKPGPDGKDQSVAPFGFGIRADGKIIYGARADEWMDKDIQQQ